jgi:hypothetical protein
LLKDRPLADVRTFAESLERFAAVIMSPDADGAITGWSE